MRTIHFDKNAVARNLLNLKVLFCVYCVMAIGATLHKIALGHFMFNGCSYLPLQNFVIFRNAFFHLLHSRDLYAAFPLEQWDLFKYSPQFALLMAPFAALPYVIGAVAWNLLNALVLFFAVRSVPGMTGRSKALVLWFILLSALGSLQNAQSNCLMAGLMLGAFNAREGGKNAFAALWIVLAILLKPFGLFGIIPCLLQPGRLKFIKFMALWTILFTAAPLAVISLKHYSFLFHSWHHLLQRDLSHINGLSVMGWLESWFGIVVPVNWMVLAGILMLAVPLLRFSAFAEQPFRLKAAASILVWVVIFNHMAESPTLIIAVCGIALWYFAQPSSRVNLAILVLTFIFTILSSTDIFPAIVRKKAVEPYVLKAVPCIVAWFVMQWEMLRFRGRQEERSEKAPAVDRQS